MSSVRLNCSRPLSIAQASWLLHTTHMHLKIWRQWHIPWRCGPPQAPALAPPPLCHAVIITGELPSPSSTPFVSLVISPNSQNNFRPGQHSDLLIVVSVFLPPCRCHHPIPHSLSVSTSFLKSSLTKEPSRAFSTIQSPRSSRPFRSRHHFVTLCSISRLRTTFYMPPHHTLAAS